MAQFTCPQCNTLMEVASDVFGAMIACPHCGQQLRLPDPPASAAPTRPLTMSRIIDRRFQPSNSLWDLFDLKFEKYVTPLIIRVTWMIVLLIAGLWIVTILGMLVLALLPEMDLPKSNSIRRGPEVEFTTPAAFSESPMPSTVAWLTNRLLVVLAALTSIVGVGLMVLWIRVSLETVIVIFNIAKTLTSMDGKLTRE